MKKFIYVFLFLFLAYGSTNAQILLVENFAYPAGDSIGAHGWVYNTGTINPLMVTAPGLTYTGYPGSGVGNALTLKPTGNDAYKNMLFSDSTGSIYCSFMLRVDTVRGTGDYFFAFLPATSTTNYTARVYVKDTLGGMAFGLSKGSATQGPIVYSPATFQRGITYLVVAKYKFVTGGTDNDSLSLYVSAGITPTFEPLVATVGPITGTSPTGDAPNLGRVAVRQGNASISPYAIIDGFRVSKSWAGLITGIQNTSTVAESFQLSQNYPNPFNPTTNIKFSLPSNGKVTLKVYNTLGKEVSALVNSNLSMGEYTVDFNAKGLTSGLYFYKLEFSGLNGNYISDIKKMMLVK